MFKLWDIADLPVGCEVEWTEDSRWTEFYKRGIVEPHHNDYKPGGKYCPVRVTEWTEIGRIRYPGARGGFFPHELRRIQPEEEESGPETIEI